MNLKTNTLRPGYLVSLKTSLVGNVKYAKTVIDPDHDIGDGSRKETWQTDRLVKDAAEHERGTKARNDARNKISRACAQTAFGLLCPESDRDALETAVRAANDIVASFNADATIEKLRFYVLVGKIAETDREALRSIKSEVADLIAEMQENIKNLDVDKIRAVARKATQVGKILSPEASAPLQEAIAAAKEIAKEIRKAGDVASFVVDEEALNALERSRIAFVEIEGNTETEAPDDTGTTRVIDLEPEAIIDEFPETTGRQYELAN